MFEECVAVFFLATTAIGITVQVCLKTNSLWIVYVYLKNYTYFS